ncbi:hypothetical protein M758_UG307100 [Ceratodon purpureus]|nr:hypothetical protein M758_UG307100 [Ceratodon purpureus]
MGSKTPHVVAMSTTNRDIILARVPEVTNGTGVHIMDKLYRTRRAIGDGHGPETISKPFPHHSQLILHDNQLSYKGLHLLLQLTMFIACDLQLLFQARNGLLTIRDNLP